MTDELEECVKRAANGEQAALEELMARFLPGLHAFVRLKAGPLLLARESSSDLVQSACREALSDLEGFEYRSEPELRAWIYSVAQRKIASRYAYHRAQKREVTREVRGEVDRGRGGDPQGFELEGLAASYASLLTPSRHAMAAEFVQRVEAAFGELADAQREALLLSRSAGLTHEQIAERMQRTPGSIRMLISRALATLAKRLDDG